MSSLTALGLERLSRREKRRRSKRHRFCGFFKCIRIFFVRLEGPRIVTVKCKTAAHAEDHGAQVYRLSRVYTFVCGVHSSAILNVRVYTYNICVYEYH